MKKRIAVIGKGTAGSQAIIHYLRYMPDCEIQWYFDENIPVQSVGEGSNLILPINLYENLNFSHADLSKIDATLKTGIYKTGWGKTGNPFFHNFQPPTVGLHFNARSLQDYIYESVKNNVTIINKNINISDIDSDYIMDCSGKPKTYEDFHKSSFIPVNAAYITQCYWDHPKFQYTLTLARPYGWVFGIPLKNRCSIGYLFNRNIDDLSSIKDDVLNIFKEYNLTPSKTTSYLEFENYYRKQNYEQRVVHNGNNSFFLEPLEATSIGLMSSIQRDAFDLWNNNANLDYLNSKYLNSIKEIETIIMLHYYSGSIYDTEFWKFAKEKGKESIETAFKSDNKFFNIVKNALEIKKSNLCGNQMEYGSWWLGSFCENLTGLGIETILKNICNLTIQSQI